MRPQVGTNVDIVGGRYKHHTGVVVLHLPVLVRVRLQPNPPILAIRTKNKLVNLFPRQLQTQPSAPIIPQTIPQALHPTISQELPVSPAQELPDLTPELPSCLATEEMELIARLGAMSIRKHPNGPTEGMSTFLLLLQQANHED
jgi:hypothetical protein